MFTVIDSDPNDIRILKQEPFKILDDIYKEHYLWIQKQLKYSEHAYRTISEYKFRMEQRNDNYIK